MRVAYCVAGVTSERPCTTEMFIEFTTKAGLLNLKDDTCKAMRYITTGRFIDSRSLHKRLPNTSMVAITLSR
jgi:hypothetical protein